MVLDSLVGIGNFARTMVKSLARAQATRFPGPVSACADYIYRRLAAIVTIAVGGQLAHQLRACRVEGVGEEIGGWG